MGSDSSGSSLLHLQWNSYSTCWHAALSTLRTTGQFCDLTLVVDDGHLPAHRAVVTSCSPLLSRALAVCHHPHPAVVLRGVNMVQMKGILDFMYMGETRVEQGALETFLKAAEELSVTGLSGSPEECLEHEDKSGIIDEALIGKTTQKRPSSSPACASPESKKAKTDEIKLKKIKQKKPKKKKKEPDQEDESDVKSSTTKEDYEETSPFMKKPTNDAGVGDKHDENDFAEPEIVFKKVFTPEKNCTKPDNKIAQSPKKVLDDVTEELTVTITPSPKKKVNRKDDARKVESNSEGSVLSGDKHSSPKRRISPGGPGPSRLPPTNSPDKSSSMTNLPQDRAKLRDIWDTLVAPEEIEGEIVYSCLCCEKTFRGKSAKSNAWSHVDHNHTPHIEHKCHICDFTSKSNDGISRHISKIHKKEQAKKEEQRIEEEDGEEDMIVLD